ncbi:hypothetical protein [Mycobacterium talmoniae]|uniref:Uncharacterized protein n=1 Tax=Mycobacterium talmoniae TaxID=1858794 RepID=A0A2S8BCP9_9MYCO|nr:MULTISPECIES: hypothetical protein [Mycobacterium]PQM44440.1 hypothetical protein C1Y40_05400 [Mycobacterium talmoniae]
MNNRLLVEDPYVNLAPGAVNYGANAIRSVISTAALLGLLVIAFLMVLV